MTLFTPHRFCVRPTIFVCEKLPEQRYGQHFGLFVRYYQCKSNSPWLISTIEQKYSSMTQFDFFFRLLKRWSEEEKNHHWCLMMLLPIKQRSTKFRVITINMFFFLFSKRKWMQSQTELSTNRSQRYERSSRRRNRSINKKCAMKSYEILKPYKYMFERPRYHIII